MSETAWAEVAAWLAARAERTIETSCARVFLAGDLAWKIKRPVSLGFLDFSTPALRRWAIERELVFNRRWAPGIYRAVRTVTRSAEGLEFDGDGAALEAVLEMRRFDPAAVLDHGPERLDGSLAETLGRLIGRAHVDAPVALDGGGAAALGYTVATNEDSLRRVAPFLGSDAVERLIEATRQGLDDLTPLLEERRRQGFARPCHGDLHLGNILLQGGRPIPFDCIEFNDRLSRIDILYDAAFPIMDLVVRGRAAAANRLMNAWLDETARGFPAALWKGLAALPFMLGVRAAVRAHVVASTGDAAAAAPYMAAAEQAPRTPPPRLIAVGGLSGTGKTTFARRLAPLVDGAPGAVVLRSDEVRKRLMNAGPLEALSADAYAPAVDARVYDQMFEAASGVLDARRTVILDATFLSPVARTQAEALARRCGVPFQGLWLEGDSEILRARVAARAGDASQADAAVLGRQLAREVGALAWLRIDIASDLEQAIRALA